MNNNWFEVDRKGLRDLLGRRGIEFVVYELIQNAWDQNVTHVDVRLTPLANRPAATLHVVDDDPDGFADLRDAFTLFGDTSKRRNAEQRGRFNVGEKLVLSLCHEAKIVSTTGGYRFDATGRHRLRERTDSGSEFVGTLPMTRAEYGNCVAAIRRLIPPAIPTRFNGVLLSVRPCAGHFEASLPTELADDEGRLRRTVRKTRVNIYEPIDGETPSIYEMGIPVVETGDRWHVDVQQKVPLTIERDNVPASYRRLLRALVLNELSDVLTKTEATESWVSDGLEDKQIDDHAVVDVLDKRYGKKRVVYDPSDPESNKIAMERGYKVVHGASLSGKAWDNVRRAEAIKPASKVTPSPKAEFSAVGDDCSIPEDKWTEKMRAAVQFVRHTSGFVLAGTNVDAGWISVRDRYAACYGSRTILFNKSRMGPVLKSESWASLLSLIVHELAHETCGDHFDRRYTQALSDIGSEYAWLAITEPERFDVLETAWR